MAPPYGYVLGTACATEADVARAVDSALWLTYRCGFPEMTPYAYTDDAGWGCMLRSAQMLLANALLRHGAARADVLSWFADRPGPAQPYSIHNMVRCGQRYDMLPGEWYGPGVAAHVLRDLVAAHGLEPELRVLVAAAERPLCVEEVLDDMTQHAKLAAEDLPPPAPDVAEGGDPLLNPPAAPEDPRIALRAARMESAWDAALMVVIPLRLGLDALETAYVPQLLRALAWPQSLGLLGGRPRAALFFPGFEAADGCLVGLDPHTVQPALGAGGRLDESTVVCDGARRVEAARIDPSLALAFYCANRESFLDLRDRTAALPRAGETPLFHVAQAREAHPGFADDSDEDA
eukprot:CAMPEP_0119274872 /NCGR_PEP_ID=MMETSP1329-20130426/12832_1 /TAXON_ID=114041 /ORGANISM="Genus nov. species nov., Strain RCC1024" /LENGTH=347 /DNA_ID=CAMNT_0007275223 /DNA_START=115 /DNA_END=1154 /DNA_ORIENTATION=+